MGKHELLPDNKNANNENKREKHSDLIPDDLFCGIKYFVFG